MSHHHYDPALEAELNRRRTTLQYDAQRHHLARLTARAARTAASRIVRPGRPAGARTGGELTGRAPA